MTDRIILPERCRTLPVVPPVEVSTAAPVLAGANAHDTALEQRKRNIARRRSHDGVQRPY